MAFSTPGDVTAPFCNHPDSFVDPGRLHADLSPAATSLLARATTSYVQPILGMPIEFEDVEDYSVTEEGLGYFRFQTSMYFNQGPQSSLSLFHISLFPRRIPSDYSIQGHLVASICDSALGVVLVCHI
jgi:hypothetical protein